MGHVNVRPENSGAGGIVGEYSFCVSSEETAISRVANIDDLQTPNSNHVGPISRDGHSADIHRGAAADLPAMSRVADLVHPQPIGLTACVHITSGHSDSIRGGTGNAPKALQMQGVTDVHDVKSR